MGRVNRPWLNCSISSKRYYIKFYLNTSNTLGNHGRWAEGIAARSCARKIEPSRLEGFGDGAASAEAGMLGRGAGAPLPPANYPKGEGGAREAGKIRANWRAFKGRWSQLGWRARETSPPAREKCWGEPSWKGEKAGAGKGGRKQHDGRKGLRGTFRQRKSGRERGERHEKARERAGEELAQIKEIHQPLGTRVRFYLSPY